jgi:hypothetical protein
MLDVVSCAAIGMLVIVVLVCLGIGCGFLNQWYSWCKRL